MVVTRTGCFHVTMPSYCLGSRKSNQGRKDAHFIGEDHDGRVCFVLVAFTPVEQTTLCEIYEQLKMIFEGETASFTNDIVIDTFKLQ